MSRFSGPQGRGAMRGYRDTRYRKAVARQQALIDRGWYHRLADPESPLVGWVACTPVPLDEFQRPADREDGRQT